MKYLLQSIYTQVFIHSQTRFTVTYSLGEGGLIICSYSPTQKQAPSNSNTIIICRDWKHGPEYRLSRRRPVKSTMCLEFIDTSLMILQYVHNITTSVLHRTYSAINCNYVQRFGSLFGLHPPNRAYLEVLVMRLSAVGSRSFSGRGLAPLGCYSFMFL